MTDKCMKYYYPNESDVENYNLTCEKRNYANLNNLNFNNSAMLKYVDDNYKQPFETKGLESPFSFFENYINESYSDLCNTSSYSLKPQQKFIGQLVNPLTNINNLLIFHGLGSGKTCTSLLIAEAFRNIDNKETLYIVPAALEPQFEEEIKGEIRNASLQSCTSMCLVFDYGTDQYKREFFTNLDSKRILDQEKSRLEKTKNEKVSTQIKLKKSTSKTEIDKLNLTLTKLNNALKTLEMSIKIKEDKILAKIKKVFTITTHTKFILRLLKFNSPGQVILKEYLQPGSPLFKDNTTIVIDEIQNLVSASGSSYKILYNAIKYYINPKVRKVFLSATPIFDNAYELALTMNLLNVRAPFSTNKDEFYKMFVGKTVENEEGMITCIPREDDEKINIENACLINKDLFKYMCSGYVSYFKGGNPVAYPYKRIITLYHTLKGEHKKHYVEGLKKDVIQDILRTANALSKKSGEGSAKKDVKGIILDESDTDSISGTLTKARQTINVYLPPAILSQGIDFEESELTAAEKDKLMVNESKKYLSSLLKGDSFDEIMLKIENISVKIKNVIELALNVEGPVFVYSNFLAYGVEAFGAILDALGYSKYPKKGDPGKSYFIWSPSVESDKEITKNAKQLFNNPRNVDGSLIKFMLGTSSIKEGVSFKNLAQVHILDPWWNESRIDQIIARGFRLCSHSDLPPEKRYADVFKHVGVLPSIYSEDILPDPDIIKMFEKVREEFKGKGLYKDIPKDIDIAIRKLLTKDDKSVINQAIDMVNNTLNWINYMSIDEKIMTVANNKSSLNNDFNRELKSVGVDCEIFKNGNLIRLEETISQIGENTYQLYYKNPSDLRNYKRKGVPDTITYEDIIKRTYSYPNSKDLPINFEQIYFDENNEMIIIEEGKKLDSSLITEDLIMNENIDCWNSTLKFSDIATSPVEVKKTVKNSADIKDLIPKMRIQFLGELNDVANKGIKFSDNDRLMKLRIGSCLKSIFKDKDLDKKTRNSIKNFLNLFKKYEALDLKISRLVQVYGYTTEEEIKSLYDVAMSNPDLIDKEYKKIS